MKNKNEKEKIAELLCGYKEIRKYSKIQWMDRVRYAVNNELRYGGVVIKKEPEYLVLKNFASNFTWVLNLKQPKLRIFWKPRPNKTK
jgi:hypothetical protein